MKDPGIRTYKRNECVVFRKTREQFGGLSNMAAGFPLVVNGVRIKTAEALYQACRFPHRPDIQRAIISEKSPMTAKMRGKPHRRHTRPDWDSIRVAVMRWCLQVKLAQHPRAFGDLLLATGDGPIVEESRRDRFWGTVPVGDDTLQGANVLGRLLRELREALREKGMAELITVESLNIANFSLLGRPIGTVEGAKSLSPWAPTLFDASDAVAPIGDAVPPSNGTPYDPEPVRTGGEEASAAPVHTPEENRMTVTHKKLIEVALPLDAINAEALRRKQKAPKGWPTSFHKWWAQRPLATARAVLFAQLVDDPAACPEEFATEEEQERERQRLFRIIEELVQWDNTWDQRVLSEAREEIWKSWRRACQDNKDHPDAAILFDANVLPQVRDPFAGSGAIPLSAQWSLAWASSPSLNPVAVLICKAMIEIPPKFARSTAG